MINQLAANNCSLTINKSITVSLTSIKVHEMVIDFAVTHHSAGVVLHGTPGVQGYVHVADEYKIELHLKTMDLEVVVHEATHVGQEVVEMWRWHKCGDCGDFELQEIGAYVTGKLVVLILTT